MRKVKNIHVHTCWEHLLSHYLITYFRKGSGWEKYTISATQPKRHGNYSLYQKCKRN